MVTIYSNDALQRQIGTIKTRLYNDGFYNTKIVARTIRMSGASGLFDISAVAITSDVVVNGIREDGPTFTSYDNVVETIDAKTRFTCREIDKLKLLNATEMWLDVTFTGTSPVYASGSSRFTTGDRYKIKSHKSDMFELDHIFLLNLTGEQNG